MKSHVASSPLIAGTITYLTFTLSYYLFLLHLLIHTIIIIIIPIIIITAIMHPIININ